MSVRTSAETQLHIMSLLLDELNFKHHAIPRFSSSVYLKVKARNTSPYTLLPGRVNVFMDNNFVTTGSRLDKVVNPEQQFELFLGTDSGVHVEYKTLKNYQQTEGLLTSSTVDVVDTVSYITNGKQAPINITIYDQVPLSTDEKIKVELIKPSESAASSGSEQTTDSKIKVKIHPQLKYIRWSGTMESSEAISLPVKYKVSYPPKTSVQTLTNHPDEGGDERKQKAPSTRRQERGQDMRPERFDRGGIMGNHWRSGGRDEDDEMDLF